MGQSLCSHQEDVQTTVIIPTYNEADNIQNTISSIHLNKSHPVNIIVSDAYSTDQTVRLARRNKNVKILRVRGSRAIQQNMAAKLVKTPYILFLHADTTVPPNFDTEINRILSSSSSAGCGAFRLHINNTNKNMNSFSLRVVERVANWRSSFLQRPYGDQGLFFTRDVFNDIGGFSSNMSFLEDYEIIRRVSTKYGRRISIADLSVATSSRRWDSLGVFQTTLLNQFIIAAYHFGVPVPKLRSWYRGAVVRASRRNFKRSAICSTPQC